MVWLLRAKIKHINWAIILLILYAFKNRVYYIRSQHILTSTHPLNLLVISWCIILDLELALIKADKILFHNISIIVSPWSSGCFWAFIDILNLQTKAYIWFW